MAKQLNVNLGVTADTSQAKAQLAELQQSLQAITKMPAQSNLFSDVQLKQASKAAQELEMHLSKAVNVNTGKLDLARFSASIKSSEKDLTSYMNKLMAIGPQGQKTFLQLAKSIASAEAPTLRANQKLQQLGTTLKNTARWQISSSILHGFMGSIQSAYSYAQKLDKSLTDIRIVTGQSSDEMAKFAAQANKSAKALSSTTTAYTDAALIYYQQGLGDKAVKERTDATIKMSNVTGEAVKDVSSYMTAIWNNFNKQGDQTVEHFGDIMTKLGAETAASTAEIADGLSKFSAVADTIGLSFEMATSTVTAIVDQTREAPEVVGTALKTIFSRVEGLSLGETLEDGTDLNKYSKGLAKVGVDIKTATGELKDMDTILHEIGDVWETLNRDQQVALAQTVAGVRQYNQFTALFDNWGSVEENLSRAATAGGTLDEQAQIYAESWEAAQKRVKAAAENIWDSLLDDKFFIGILNGVEKVLEGVGGLVDGLGGLKGAFLLIGSIFMRHFAQSMPRVLENLRLNIMTLTGQAEKEANKVQQKTKDRLTAFQSNTNVDQASKIEAQGIQKVIEMKEKLAKHQKTMTDSQKAEYQARIDNVESLYKEAAAIQRKVQEMEEELQAQKTLAGQNINEKMQKFNAAQEKKSALESKLKAHNDGTKVMSDAELKATQAALEKVNIECVELDAELDSVKSKIIGVDGEMKKLTPEEIEKVNAEVGEQVGKFSQVFTKYNTLQQLIKTIGDQSAAWEKLSQETDEHGEILKEVKQDAQNFVTVIKSMAKEAGVSGKVLDTQFEKLEGTLNDEKATVLSIAQAFDTFLGNVTSDSGKFTKAIQGMDQYLDNLRQSLYDLGMTDEQLKPLELRLEAIAKKKAEASKNQNMGAGKSAEDPIAKPAKSQAITEYASAIMGLQSTITSVTSCIKVFEDESSSAMEKFGAVLAVVTSAMFAFQGVVQLTNIATELGIFAHISSAAAKASEAGATGLLSAANLGLLATMPPILVVTLALVASLVALAAIVWAVTAAIKAFQASTPEGKLKAAQEEARALGDELNRVKEEAQALEDSFSNYDSITEKLDSCVKGTEEWKDALRDANNEVINLMQQYPELATMVNEQGEEAITRNADGQLEIADWAREELEAKSDAKVAAAQGAYNRGQQNVRAAKVEVDRSNIADELYSDAGGRSFGEQIAGAILNPVGSIMSTISDANKSQVSNVIAANAEKLSGLSGSELKTELREIFNKNGIIASVDKWAGYITEMGGDFTALTAAVEANTAAMEVENQNTAEEILSDSALNNSENGRMAMGAAGEAYSQIEQEAYDKYMQTDMANFGVGTSAGKDMFEQYASQMGLDSKDGFKVTDYTKDSVKYEYIDENGQKQEAEATKEMIASTLAAADAAGQLEDAMIALQKQIGKLKETGDEGDSATAKFLSEGNLEGTTKAEFDDLKSDVGFKKDEDGTITYDQEVLDEKLGLSGKTWDEQQEIAKNAGYESAEAYRQAFVESMDVDFEVPKELTDAGIITDQMSMGASKKISETYENMGKEGGDAFLGAIDMVTKNADFQNLSPEDQTAAWNELANIDWTSWEAGDEAAKIMRNYGVEIDVTDEKWRQFINTMRDSQDALPDMSKFREDMQAINDIVSDIDLGSILSKEDYDTLVAYNSELGKYFTILSDGSAQFTGDKLDFEQEVQESHKTKLRENTGAYTDQIREDEDKLAKGSEFDLDAIQGVATKGNEDGNGIGVGNRGGAGDDGVYSQATQDKLNSQFDFLESQGYEQNEIDNWKAKLEDGTLDPSHIRDIGNAVKETTADFEGLENQIKENQEVAQGGMNELAMMAEGPEERQQMLESGEINSEAYGAAAMADINAEKWEDMDTEEVDNYSDHLMEAAESSELLSDELKNNKEAAEDVALYTKKMNKGVEKLSEGYEDWSDVLKKSDKASEEYCDAMDGMKDAMSDLLGTSEDFIEDDFILENLEDIEKAAEGDADAIDRLKNALAKDILCNIMAVDNFDEVNSDIQDLHNEIAGLDKNIEVGATLKDDGFAAAAQGIVDAAGMTVDQAQAYFNSLGYEPEFVMQNETRTAPMYGKRVYTDDPVIATVEVGDGSQYPYIAEMTTHEEQVYMGEQEQNFVVPALSADGTPKIRSLTKVSSGKMNNSSSSNSGGKKSGGGGGGKGGGNTKKDKKKKKDEIERYHEVKNSLEDVSKALDKVSKAKERAWGKDKMKAIKEEIDLLDKEIGLQEQYVDEIEKNLFGKDGKITGKDGDAGVLSSKYGVTFDKDGNISNYDEVMEEQIDIFNSKRTDAAEEAYNDFKEAIELYEETHDLWLTEKAAYQDMLDEQYDKLTELATAEFEITMEIDAQTQEYLDWLIGQSEDDIFQAADRIASISLSSQSTANANNSENGGEELIRDILENDNHNLSQKTIEGFLNNEDWAVNKVSQEKFTADEIEQLEEGAAAMREAASKLREDETAIHEELRNIISETTDQMDRQIDIIDTLTDMIQTYVDIVDVVGKKVLKMSNSDIKNLERSSLEGSRAALRSSKEEYETLKTERDALYDEYAKIEATLDETSKAKWKETLQEADDAMLEAQSNYTSRWQETLEKAAEIFENEVTRTLEEFSTTMTGAFKGSLEELQDAFDQQQEISQLYVQDYKKIYELSKLTRDISTSIDKTDNLEATRELADLQGKIAEYEEAGVQMSQYEIDHLRKKYELKLAEIALEESQNAKSQVRMQRDSEGNYGYVYTANEEDVAAAEQSYEDKLYEMQELNGEYINELQSNILQLQQDLSEELANVNRADFENTEEYTAKLNEIKARYYEKMGFYTSQMNTALDNQKDVYENDWANYSEATGYKISTNEDFVDSWDETTLAVLTGFENIEDYAKTFYDSLDTTLGDLSGAFDQWYQDVDGIMKDAGSSIETFGEDVEKTVGDSKNGLIKDINDAENAVSELKTAFEQLMQNSGEKATGWYNSWNKKMQDLAKQAGLTSQAIIRLLETGKDDDDKKDNDDDDKPATTPTTKPTTTTSTKTLKKGSKVKFLSGRYYNDSYGGGPSGSWGHGEVHYITKVNKSGTKPYHISKGKTLGDRDRGWLTKSQLKALNTGGYTGSWGSNEGRLALLHQKEIVLNAEDTANFLKAVDIVRDIASKIDLNAGIAQNGIGAMAAAGIKEHNQTLEQQVSIQANFPNATNHSEIEQAFENLVNMASQYANRK